MTDLEAFLDRDREAIVASWRDRMRDTHPAGHLSDRALVDHLPDILDQLGKVAGRDPSGPDALNAPTGEHAVQRLSLGFDVEDVVDEYAVLRQCILELWERDAEAHVQVRAPDVVRAIQELDAAIDGLIGESVARYAEGRERMVRILDRIAEAALASSEPERFLQDLVCATTSASVRADAAALLLAGDGPRLRLGAIHGMDGGTAEALAARPSEPAPGLRAIFAAPLVHGDQELGVAIVASRSSDTFSREDRQLFRSMVSRAVGVIVHARVVAAHRLAQRALELALDREREAEVAGARSLALVDSLLAACPIALAFLDGGLRFVRVNARLASVSGVSADAHLGRTVGELLPDEAGVLEPALRRVIDTGQPVRALELAVRLAATPDRPRTFLVGVFPVHTPEGDPGAGVAMAEITEQKLAQEQAERGAAELGAVLQSIPDPVLVADSGGVRTVNRAAVVLLGATSEEELVRDLRAGWADLDPRDPSTGAKIAPGDLPLVRAMRGGRTVVEMTLRTRSRRGDVVVRAAAAPVELDGRVLGAVTALTDVTDRRRAADFQRFLSEASVTLAESLDYETTLAAVAQMAVPGFADLATVHLVEPSGTVRRVAAAHADPTLAALARELQDRYPPGPDQPFGIATVLATGEAQWSRGVDDSTIAAAARDERHLRILQALDIRSYIVVPLLARGRTLGTLAFVASGTRPAFDELDLEIARELGRRAGLAVDNAGLYLEAQEAVRLREQVLAVVSHDLRNPLWAIKMGLNILSRTSCSSESQAHQQVELLRRSASRMERMIRDLLDIASIQGGKLSVGLCPEDPAALVAEAAEHQGPLVTGAGRRLVVLPLPHGLAASCDRERILQVFDNLVGNAMKFTPPGGTITLGLERVAEGVRFTVSDTGAGIDPDDLPHLFEPYWKGSSQAARRGTGLGLYICRGIVEAHGGRLAVDSAVGVGTTFSFTLPPTPS